MIKEIFLPEKTATRRLISQRIIGIVVRDNTVHLAKIHATPAATIVEKLDEKVIPGGAPDRYNERAAHVMKTMLEACGKFDQIKVSIPSSIVTFKELTLPFLDIEKIRMVLEYEVEPKLPFSLNEAVLDFIITNTDKKEKKSQVLVAAVRKQDLQNIFDIYTLAEIDPDTITVDLFSLYGLYLQIPDYKNISGASALIDIGLTFTTIALLIDGQMRLIRTIGKGIGTIAQNISKEIEKPVEQVIQDLVNFGTNGLETHVPDSDTYNKAAKKYLSTFLNGIQFTLNSFSLKLHFYKAISTLLFVGKGSHIKGLIDFSSTMLQLPCQRFSIQKLFQTKEFKDKTKILSNTNKNPALALATAAVYGPYEHCNLRKKEFAKTHYPLLNKQLLTGLVLVFAIFMTIGLRGFLQITNLESIVKKKEKQAIVQLKKVFPPKHSSRRKKNLRALFRDAQREVEDRRKAWQPFLQENLQPLEILKDLTHMMDKKAFHIKIEKITITLDDTGVPIADLSGFFASKPGQHFTDFGNYVKFFEQNSAILSFREEHDVDEAEVGKGVKFSFKLRRKEQL